MSVTDQVDALQKHADDVKSSLKMPAKSPASRSRHGSRRPKPTPRPREGRGREAGQAAERAKSQWKAMKADVGAKAQALQDRINRRAATSATSRRPRRTPSTLRTMLLTPSSLRNGQWTRRT